MKKLFTSKVFISFIIICGGIIVLGSIFLQNFFSPNIKINEVSFQNNNGNDWIEIYNPSFTAKSLKGYYITDDKTDYTKFQITEDILINPQEFVILYGKNYEKTPQDKKKLQINFGIKNGETIYLIAPNQIEIIDEMTILSLDETSNDTIGRYPDGRDAIFTLSTPTQGIENQKEDILNIKTPE